MTWTRLESDPCPSCDCCSARLCMRAAMDGKTCLQLAPVADHKIVAKCPCAVKAVRS